MVVAWHASQHASPAVEGALHFELQACTFFPARLADWDPRPSRLVAGFAPCRRYSCARSRTATARSPGIEPGLVVLETTVPPWGSIEASRLPCGPRNAVPGFASPCWRGEWSRSLRVLFLGSHGSLEHVNVAVRT